MKPAVEMVPFPAAQVRRALIEQLRDASPVSGIDLTLRLSDATEVELSFESCNGAGDFTPLPGQYSEGPSTADNEKRQSRCDSSPPARPTHRLLPETHRSGLNRFAAQPAAQILDQRPRRGIAPRWLMGHGLQADGLQVAWDVGPNLSRRAVCAHQHLLHQQSLCAAER